ncbi:hypothetical protein VZT92_020409 [Zoarces viviparus]|uniref:Peptidase M60 domain-containing protein n=1 Tax=Zoarces viviparus TaxID=48416 RepID=A0AAW1EDH3_ZOAVI
MSTHHVHPQSYYSLTRGIKELDIQGPFVPSELLLTGDHAFPLAMNSKGQVLMAASLYGRGRIVVLGHEGYLTTFPALVENALTWLRGDGSDNLSVGVHKDIKGVADNLSKCSFQATVVGAFSENREVGVYVTDAYSIGADVKDLVAFLKAGGGVLIGGQAWSWAQQHPKENANLHFPGNKVSAVAGIYFTVHRGEVEILPVHPQIPSSWMALRVGKDFADDLEVLLRGVSRFDISKVICASEALVHGPLAFPIGTTEDGRVFLAGTYYGKGRVIVVTHELFFFEKELASFWNNAISWLDQGRKGLVGVKPKQHLLRESGLKYEETELRKDLSVFVCTAYSDDRVEEIQDFVAEGGGLLIGGHAWHWAQTHPGQNTMTEHSGNKILNKMGLSVLPATISESSFKVHVPTEGKNDTEHFLSLLRLFAGHVAQGEKLEEEHLKEHLRKLGVDCTNYLRMMAHDSCSYTNVLSILTGILKSNMPQVSEKNPVNTPEDHLLLRLGRAVYNVSQDPDALLPFLIKPLMPTVGHQRIMINANTAGEKTWISTGLYLFPGMKTEMIIPANMVNKSWMILIGCQTDYLDAEELKRAPYVHEQFLVTSEKMQVWNLWGGLIYLLAPPNTKVEGEEVIVQMAVPAPYYKSGVTTAAHWSFLRKSPSPWAELEFDNIILSVPSDVVRDLESLDEVEQLWNKIMRAIADLSAIPHRFPRKERIVADVQISHGFVHTGHPVMMNSSGAPQLVKTAVVGTKHMWGVMYGLGHSQLKSCWQFPPHTSECLGDLWSAYVHEVVLGINMEEAHPNLTFESRKSRTEEYVNGGKELSDWKGWVALETYVQLQYKFGWDAFKKVFAAYHEMTDFPSDNNGKMNLYAVTFSQTVGMDLSAFFKAWGWPIETATEEKLYNLDTWMDHPMVDYEMTLT